MRTQPERDEQNVAIGVALGAFLLIVVTGLVLLTLAYYLSDVASEHAGVVVTSIVVLACGVAITILRRLTKR